MMRKCLRPPSQDDNNTNNFLIIRVVHRGTDSNGATNSFERPLFFQFEWQQNQLILDTGGTGLGAIVRL